MGRNIRGVYPAEWPAVARAVKDEAGWRCVRCGHRAESPTSRMDCDDACDVARHPEWGTRHCGGPARRGSDGRIYVQEGRRRQRVLTVAHLDDDKSNCNIWNLCALCQVCHLSTQSRIEMQRPWVLDHSEWFKPYVAGFYAHKYLGEVLTMAQIKARLPELLELEMAALGMAGGAA